MDELTEREAKLLEVTKKLISALSVYGIFEGRLIELIKWKQESLDSIGLNIERQNKFLHDLEIDFGLRFIKYDNNGNPLKEEDGN